MGQEALWQNKLYVESALIIIAFLALVGPFVYYMKTKSPKWTGAWASIKSWVFATPAVLIVAALPDPWPFLGLLLAAIYGAKTFFRMTGMYHRSWFVWLSYIFILIQGHLIYHRDAQFYDILPMVFFATMILIPIFRNSASHMIQYTALSLMNMIFMGWGFMYLGRIMMWETGVFILLYLFILSEVCDSTLYTCGRLFGRFRPLSNLTNRFTVEGFVVSILITVVLAWGLRRMLPSSEEAYWLTAAISISVFGRIGSLFMSTIRRDLGIKDTGVFIIGRDDILARIDKFVFIAPIVYFMFIYLQYNY